MIIRQNDCLQDIDHLRDAGKFDAVTVLIENIECDSRHQRVTHSALLIQKSGIGAGLHAEPSS